MLVIVSDLHLTDGTTARTLDADAFRMFVERMQDMAVRASWRSDDRYRPLDGIDIVLLGDVLDLVNSAAWLSGLVRPWSSAVATAEQTATIVDDVLQHNHESIEMLESLANRGAIRIPMATNDGKPAFDVPLQPVPVRLYYMVGDADWLLYRSGDAITAIRRKICQAMGLTNAPDAPFPHDPSECPQLARTLSKHRVYARHGDIFDPLSFRGRRDESSLADAIVIEGAMRFVQSAAEKFGKELPLDLILALEELTDVRPLTIMPTMLVNAIQRSCGAKRSLQYELRTLWDEQIEQMLDASWFRSQRWSDSINIDQLAGQFLLHRNAELRHEDSLLANALTESEFRNRRAKYVVYGHTHRTVATPMEASYADGFVLNQIYFNSGSWRRTYDAATLAQPGGQLVASDSINLLAFYQGDERHGRPYETWSTMLGSASSTIRQVRIDGAETASPIGSISSSKSPKMDRPHFFQSGSGASRFAH
ncbi:hypothetical protein LOC68_16470 [Blastopirellula sp. JC732]|uniref:Calcineurin-like phosphoesterase domain-containing protein n=1 Tax=Blastopirellula sediminis TaxID=2894196 RepID=A0A9X1MMP8_9BACT|nr:hypothetical protein [Blastopirellula sediminis]MCC9606715.1 hypothetical protein [Blastopirellula sediminis]MCC9629988.1 hypothetical protein [Blastopirellula sediminis]